MSRADDLLKRARRAKPSKDQAPLLYGRYDAAWPAFKELVARGFGQTPAIDWLIDAGEIAPEDRSKAYRALRGRLEREKSATK